MTTSTSQEQVPPFEEIVQQRQYWKMRLKLRYTQTKHLTTAFMEQLMRCKSDEARRILVAARNEGHRGRKNQIDPHPEGD
jgi:hypothetical protein